MRHVVLCFLIQICTLGLVGCSFMAKSKVAEMSVKSSSSKSIVPQTISLYRYGDFPIAKALKLKEGLKPYFKKVVLDVLSLDKEVSNQRKMSFSYGKFRNSP